VIETLLGVQFAPIESFSIPHFGLYWTRIRDSYPNQEVKPPLGPIVEEFGDRVQLGLQLGIELSDQPDVRCWFIDESSAQLIQVQRDRFIRNWRKVRDGDLYPRYANLKPRFRDDWEDFCSFLEDAGLRRPEITQCEVTYINHITSGRGWEGFGRADKVLTVLSSDPGRVFLPEPEIVHLNLSFLMPDKRGRLRVTLQPAIRRQDAKEVLQLTLTARGRPVSPRTEDVLEWLDIGHEWIVRGFADLTTRDMHNVWGRTA